MHTHTHTSQYIETPYTMYGAYLYIEMCVCVCVYPCHFFGPMNFCQNPAIVSIRQQQLVASITNEYVFHSLYSQYKSRKRYLNKCFYFSLARKFHFLFIFWGSLTLRDRFSLKLHSSIVSLCTSVQMYTVNQGFGTSTAKGAHIGLKK